MLLLFRIGFTGLETSPFPLPLPPLREEYTGKVTVGMLVVFLDVHLGRIERGLGGMGCVVASIKRGHKDAGQS